MRHFEMNTYYCIVKINLMIDTNKRTEKKYIQDVP